MDNPFFYEKLENYCTSLEDEFDQILPERMEDLRELGEYIAAKNEDGLPARITVICTHNSRRSHFGQVWLAVAAAYFNRKLMAYSGGTEATAFHPNAVAALQRTGLVINQLEEGDNPVYALTVGPNQQPASLCSKRFDDPANPKRSFAAVMVCSEADEACPFVPGAEARFALPYFDPKLADGTPRETEVYDERCRQIAREMFYAVKVGLE